MRWSSGKLGSAALGQDHVEFWNPEDIDEKTEQQQSSLRDYGNPHLLVFFYKGEESVGFHLLAAYLYTGRWITVAYQVGMLSPSIQVHERKANRKSQIGKRTVGHALTINSIS